MPFNLTQFLMSIKKSTVTPPTKTPILKQSSDLIKLQSSFLDNNSVISLANTCHDFRNILSFHVKAIKKTAEARAQELLDCVVNIDEERKKRILELLALPNLSSQSIILIPSHGKAKSLQKWFCSKKREFTRIEFNDLSALQAAALCGDFFIVNLFIDKIPAHQRYAAGLQLKKIRERKDYLAPFFALQQAYREYLKGVESHGKGYQYSFWDFLEDKSECLWERVGECQKKLSNFGLQVLSNPILYGHLPYFSTQEPVRLSLLNDDEALDLGKIGISTQSALAKGYSVSKLLPKRAKPENYWCGGTWNIGNNAEEWNLICEVVQNELNKAMILLLNYAHNESKEKMRV